MNNQLIVRMKNTLQKGLLIVIVSIAFILRVFHLESFPPSLNWDEVSLGYNAYSILTTGKDEWGNRLPVIFKAYGDYKLPGYVYIITPFIGIFGLNEFGVRFPSAVAGTITVLFTYLFVKRLLNSSDQEYGENHSKTIYPAEKFALLSALLVAVEPWSLFLSRPAFEANLALCFFTVGIYYFLKSFESRVYILLSTFLFGLTIWTYNSYRVFTPLFILYLLIIFNKRIKEVFKYKRTLCFSLILTILLFLPMFYQLFAGKGQERYKKVNIVDDGAIGQIVDLRNRNNMPPLVEKLIFNRPTYFVFNFTKNIFSHFSYNYLFSKGGLNYQFSVPDSGLIYKINAIFFLAGILYLLRIRNRVSLLLLGWLFIGTVPSALTREAPHVLRSITILPIPMVIISIGFVKTCSWIKLYFAKKNYKYIDLFIKAYLSIYLIFLGIFLTEYLYRYYTDYNEGYSWSWQYGYKNVATYIKDNYHKYDKIIITKKYGEPHEFILFYTKWDPQKYQNDQRLIRFEQSDWFWVDRFDKFYFVNDWDIPKEEWQPFVLESGKETFECKKIRCLLITSPGNVPKTWNKINVIKYLNNEEAFEIYEN